MNNELNTGKSSQCMIQREEKAYKEVTDLRAASEPFQPQQKTSSASKPRAWQLKRNDSRRRSPRPPHNRSRNGVRYDVDGSTENPIKYGFLDYHGKNAFHIIFHFICNIKNRKLLIIKITMQSAFKF
jgi:hypothetical protein